jgi:amidase
MADYFSGLEINPHNLRGIEDMISCTKSHPKEEYLSRDIEYWEKVRVADDLSSEKIVAGWERMKYLGGPGGIDGALDAANADALIFPSIVSSDVPGLVGYPVITVPLGFMPADTPVKKNLRGNLVDEGPGVP